jgi:hypothetical protein
MIPKKEDNLVIDSSVDIEQLYTQNVLQKADSYDNVQDSFNELLARLDLLSMLNIDDNPQHGFSIYLYVEDIKEHIQSLEYEFKRARQSGAVC